jgi:autotransporter-associated beta strand protein
LSGNQTWTNGCDSPLVVENTIGGTSTLTLQGPGGFQLNGSNTFSGGVTTKSPSPTIYFGNDNALGTGRFTSAGGIYVVDDFPVIITNKIKINHATSRWCGDARLTLAGSDDSPALAISQWANPPFDVLGGAPFVVSGNWSLADASSGNNNSGVGPRLHSGANVLITGDIRENNAGNASSENNNGFNFYFLGAGADITIYGNNFFGAGNPNGARFVVTSNAGYNSLSIGGPGGPGAIVTPLGVAALYTNSGRGLFLKALINGQIITNNINTGASTNNDGAMPIGFDGNNDLTIGGIFSLGQNFKFPNLSDATLTFSGGVNAGSRTLTFQGPGTTVFTSSSFISGATTGTLGSVSKDGPGWLVLSGTNTSGKAAFNGGTVVLDYTSHDSNRLGLSTNNTSALTLGGVDLQLKGGSYAQELGENSGTSLTTGHSSIYRTGSGTSTLALGPISRSTSSGSTIDFESGVVSTTTATANSILAGHGYATVNKSDWAVGGGSVTALPTYDSFSELGTDKNVLVTESETVAGTSVGTLKISPTAPGQSLTLSSGTLLVYRSGILFTGSHDFIITGGEIKCRGDYLNDLIVHQHGSGVLTLNSPFKNSNNSSLVKTGDGMLVLANTNNTHSGVNYLLGGVLSVADPGSLGTASMTMHGGTLRTTDSFTYTRKITLLSNGGTFDVPAETLELSGAVAGNNGALNKVGIGTLLLSGENTYSGTTTISEGTLKLGNPSALGTSSANSNRSLSPVYVENGANMDIAGNTAFIGNFTLKDGTVSDSVGGGALGAYSFTVNEGTIDAVLTDVKVPNASNLSDSINLFKHTAGTVILTADNTYSGVTFVKEGTLKVNGSLDSAVIVETGGTLCGTGTLNRTVNVEGGIFTPGIEDTEIGMITLNRFLRIADNGVLKIRIDGSGSDIVKMTHPQTRILLQDAELDLAILEGGIHMLASGVTLVDNQGTNPVEGAFAGFPEGRPVDIGNGRFVAITYEGGNGNDIVATLQNRGSVFIVR